MMTETQHWQLISGLAGLVVILVGYIWLRQHHWIRDHEARLKVIENDHLKRSEFDGAMAGLRDQLNENGRQLAELETETRIRNEYVKEQLERMWESQIRIEGILSTKSNRSRKGGA